MPNPLDEIRSFKTRITAIAAEMKAFAGGLNDGCGRAEVENAAEDCDHIEASLDDAAWMVGKHLEFLERVASGEPWAVREHREQLAHERADYERRVRA